jgi:gas vesicle protein
MTDPDRIRYDIERTQGHLRDDVNALTEKVSPTKVAERRVQAARGAMTNVKEKIMGSASETGATARDTVSSAVSGVGDAASSAAAGVGSAASTAGEALASAPRAARQGTAGNPLAAAVIAFGAGWLVSSLLPANAKEQRLAAAVQDKAGDQLQPVARQLQQATHDLAESLREPAQHAVESVRSTAGDAASTIREEAGSATDHVTDRAQQARHTVTDRAPEGGHTGL